jgi:allantoate deiminase
MVSKTLSAKTDAAVIQSAARRVMARCDALAECTDRPGEISRFFCSPAMKAAHLLVREWMQGAGMNCRLDAAGNLIGRFSRGDVRPAILVGSHLDTVANAGRYDGILGVMLGIAVAQLARELNAELPFAIEVIAFSEEEGVRFQTPFIGSRALIGELSHDLLARTDADGIQMADALRRFECDPDELPLASYKVEDVVGFIEPHIEQGPVLEAANLPVGVVTGITGQTRASFQFVGRAGHAGAVPMNSRHDALVAAALFVAEVEKIARRQPGLVATVGQLAVRPNVSNVIPGEVTVAVDVRHQDDDIRDAAFREITHRAALIAQEREIEFDLLNSQAYKAVKCESHLQSLLEDAAAKTCIRVLRLPSGAGHDAAIVARRYPVAMLFVRCAGGVSHHPDESVGEADVAAAIEVLWQFVQNLATEQSKPLAV